MGEGDGDACATGLGLEIGLGLAAGVEEDAGVVAELEHPATAMDNTMIDKIVRIITDIFFILPSFLSIFEFTEAECRKYQTVIPLLLSKY